ncbi:MAG: DUF1207 domain-containing protein [Bacteroidota bacterium]
MKSAAVAFILLLPIWLTAEVSSADSTGFHFLPGSRMAPLLSADSRAHRTYLQSTMENRTFYFGIGTQLPVLQYNNRFQLLVGTSAHATMRRTSIKNAVLNTDYYLDIVADIKLMKYLYLRSSIGHTSHHLSDDGVSLGYVNNNYQRDYISVHALFNYDNVYTLYGGVCYNTVFRATVTQTPKSMVQFGADVALFGSRKAGYIFVAFDTKWKEEVNFGRTTNALIGYRYFNSTNQAFRFVLQNTSGYDERGQFYNSKVNIVSLALQLEI